MAADHRTPRKILVGSDFSGLDSAWFALQRLQLPVELQFCSDSDAKCKVLIQGLHKPIRFHDDVTTRTPDEELPVHLYVFTPPCQPFSCQGKRGGIQDKRARAMQSSFQYIKRQRPRVALFENVPGILQKKHRPVLYGMHRALKKLGYVMWLKTLDSSNFKVPQMRRRVFIVAILKTSLRRKFKWPKGQGKRTLSSVLDPPKTSDKSGKLPKNKNAARMAKLAYSKVWAQGIDARKQLVAVDVGCSEKFLTFGVDICRTLSRTRAASGGFWLSTLGRKMSVNELARANGMLPQETEGCLEHVSATELSKMIGNSVPVPMIGEILQEAMFAAGLIAATKSFPC